MSRYSPSVERRAPPSSGFIDIGSALGNLAGGLSQRWDNQARAREKAEAEAAAAAAERYRRSEAKRLEDKADLRYSAEQAVALADRTRRRQSEYVTTIDKARDEGLISGADRERQRRGYAAVGAAGNAMGSIGFGLIGGGLNSISQSLLDATAGDPRMSVTKPDDTTEHLYFDPTQTKEARDAQAQRIRDDYLNSLRPKPTPPRDPVEDDYQKYFRQQEYDRLHGIGKFKKDRPVAGRGGGSGTTPEAKALAAANTRVDDYRSAMNSFESRAPKPPVFDEEHAIEGEPGWDAFKADSTARMEVYNKTRAARAGKADEMTKGLMHWTSIADSLASIVAKQDNTGIESVNTQNREAAQREIKEVSAGLAARLQGASPARKEFLRTWISQQVKEINEKYGIRPGSMD